VVVVDAVGVLVLWRMMAVVVMMLYLLLPQVTHDVRAEA
jgi:hypothetical protein